MTAVYGETKGIVNVLEQKGPFSRPQYRKIAWNADYDGDIANVDIATDINGKADIQHMRLDNSDLMKLLSVQPVNKSLEQRLVTDFSMAPIALEGIDLRRHPYSYRHRRSARGLKPKHKTNRNYNKKRRGNKYSRKNTRKHQKQ